jgi:hypothetical protein
MISRSDTQLVVRDLDPQELLRPPASPARTALEIARDICTKIGNNRPGDLFGAPANQTRKD